MTTERPGKSRITFRDLDLEALWKGAMGGGSVVRRESVEARGQEPEEEEWNGIEGVYIISVAARILEMHPQTLRKYERIGLVRPSRTVGRLRLYSDDDISKLRLIKYLVGELRLNLAGVDMAVALADRILAMRRQVAEVQQARALRSLVQGMLEDMLGILNAQAPQPGQANKNSMGGPADVPGERGA
ncbi:MAG: DNA-binding transcriptional regulator, MerR family [Chloroflexi bacterium]|jgi:MerR family transcriptional regulator/heat shock protein HspR|nr:MAG: DNA-binding transcriptional regulator, MerR family [Chloroflexota bacterium]